VLPLDDPRWGSLTHAYGAASDVPAMLRARDWRRLFEALCHQGVADTASIAAVPHLVAMDDEMAWTLVGAIARAAAPPVPQDLRDAYDDAIEVARRSIHPDTPWLAVSLAAVSGNLSLAAAIQGVVIDGEHWVECPECGHGAMIGPGDLGAAAATGTAVDLAARVTDPALADKIRALGGAAICAACHHRWHLV
jgi:hypothetical protein